MASQNACSCNDPVEGKKMPCPGVCLIYLRTLCAASRCGYRGFSMNGLNICTAYAKSGLVMVKYFNRPTRRLYEDGSVSSAPFVCVSDMFCSTGNREGLEPRNPVSSNISSAYFLWHRVIPCLDLATSIPKKYLSCPKFLSLNLLERNCLVSSMSCKLFPTSITSST